MVIETKDLKLQFYESNLLSFRFSSILKPIHLVTFLKLKNFWNSFKEILKITIILQYNFQAKSVSNQRYFCFLVSCFALMRLQKNMEKKPVLIRRHVNKCCLFPSLWSPAQSLYRINIIRIVFSEPLFQNSKLYFLK